MSTRTIAAVHDLLRDGARQRVFSEASAAWVVCSNRTHTLFSTCLNRNSQIFDLASLTKIFTASACLRLFERGMLSLDVPLSRYLPDIAMAPNGSATLEETLRHRAGFVAWYPFFEEIPLHERGRAESQQRIINAIINHPPHTAPGEKTVYSDLGYILLAHVLERITKQPFQKIIRQEVTDPLGLTSIHFRPIGRSGNSAIPIAPTEDCPWRRRRLEGEVHDDNAWTMGGIAGHAGLFGSAEDVARFGAAWIAARKQSTWLTADIAEAATSRHHFDRGLGWDFKSQVASSAGTKLGDAAFGHLGFTGCSLWVDPERQISIALLTNRVFYGRENRRIRTFRPTFHDQLVAIVDND